MNTTSTINPPRKFVKFWTRSTSGRWSLVASSDSSGVPADAWMSFNRIFWEWKNSGKLYPLDELDAYQTTVREIIKSAASHPHLKSARLSTYLVGVALKTLLKLKERAVNPVRESYRELEQKPSDLRTYLEENSSSRAEEEAEVKRRAKEDVRTTLRFLDDDTRLGLIAYMRSTNWAEAAALYNPKWSMERYRYRFRQVWAPAFISAWEQL